MKVHPIPLAQPLSTLNIQFFSHRVAAGFPSPAEDHVDQALDLNQHLIHHPSATYFVRASGHSMEGLGIYDGDLLVVDRSLQAEQGDVVIASVDGQLTCKLLDIKHRCLRPSNTAYPTIELHDETDLLIEGVVVHAIHHFRGV